MFKKLTKFTKDLLGSSFSIGENELLGTGNSLYSSEHKPFATSFFHGINFF